MKSNNKIDSDLKWGAEATLEKGRWLGLDVIRKIRKPKKYRLSQLDNELRNSRTIIESRLLIAAKNIDVQTPYIYEVNLNEATIVMENIEGILVKDSLNSEVSEKEKIKIVERIGELVGKLHTNEIIHGDLTTSNILLHENQLIFIDFGLGKFSNAIEDQAVDILLIKKCFTSTHTNKSQEYFHAFQEGYKKTKSKAITIFKRAAKVEARGRHLKEEQVIKDFLIS